MAVNVNEGKLIRLVDVPDAIGWLPLGRKGAKANCATLYDYANNGLKNAAGHVIKLEVMTWGKSLCTNEAALLRFCERLGDNAADQDTPTESQRARAYEHAQGRLA